MVISIKSVLMSYLTHWTESTAKGGPHLPVEPSPCDGQFLSYLYMEMMNLHLHPQGSEYIALASLNKEAFFTLNAE